MGKAIGRIALVAGAIAVNVIPGAGQVLSAYIGTTLSSTLAASLTVAGLQAGLSLAGIGGPRAPKPQTTEGTKREPIPPRTYAYGRRRFYGASVLFETAPDGSTVDVYAFLDGPADGVEQVYLNDDKVTIVNGSVQALPDKAYQSNLVKAGFTLGATPNTAFAPVVAKLSGIWTNAHRGDGVVTGYLIKQPEKEKYFLTTYPQGDNVQLSAVFRAQLCFDPRDGQTRWTENPVLHLLHYLTVRRGFDYATRIAPTVQYWINAANICDEAIPLAGGNTEARYRSCVSYEATAAPKEVLASLLETFDGWLAPRGDGALIVYAGKLYTPTVTIGPDEILSYRLQNYVEDENRVDQLTVSYVSEAHDWNVVEATPWGGENGARRTDAISPQTPSYSQARRLAKRAIAQANAPKRGSITTNLGGRIARGQRYIYLDLQEAGFDPFDGVPALVEISSLERDFEQGGLSFEWTLVDPNIDAWNPATEQGLPAPVGDIVSKEPLDTPLLISASAQYSDVGQSSGDPDAMTGGDPQSVTGVRLLLTASGPSNRGDLTWYARWRVGSAATWNEREYTDADPGPGVSLLTEYVPYGASVEAQVAYSSGDGRLSDWSNSKVTNTTQS